MNCDSHICEICNRHVKPDDILSIKTRSTRWDVDHWEELFADRKTIGICFDCLKEIGERVRKNSESKSNIN